MLVSMCLLGDVLSGERHLPDFMLETADTHSIVMWVCLRCLDVIVELSELRVSYHHHDPFSNRFLGNSVC